MGKLTKDQYRALEAVASGSVYMHFDVHGGYKWEQGKTYTRWKKSKHDAPASLRKMTEAGLIELGPTYRPYSGRQINQYIITDLGRAILEKDRPNGE